MSGTIYLITDGLFFKIGRTKKNAKDRLKELQTGNPSELYLIKEVKVNNPAKVESTMHRQYSYCKQLNEWFDLTLDDVENFEKHCITLDNNFDLIKKNFPLI